MQKRREKPGISYHMVSGTGVTCHHAYASCDREDWSCVPYLLQRWHKHRQITTYILQAIKIWRREQPGSIGIDAIFWQNLNQLSTGSFFVCVTTPATGVIKAPCAKQLDSVLTVHVPEYEHTKVRREAVHRACGAKNVDCCWASSSIWKPWNDKSWVHCKNGSVVLANYLILQLCNYPSYTNSKCVVLAKHSVGG